MKGGLRSFLSHLLPAAYKPFTMFPYRFVGEPYSIQLGKSETGLPYAEYEGVRVYFPADYSREEVERWFRGYLEDEGLTGRGRRTKSPHCYVDALHHPDAGDVLIDVGCSEGFFSRHYAKQASKIYLFEGEGKWNDPLKATFADCAEKVVLTQKFVGSVTGGPSVRLEDVVHSSTDATYFMKMDIEGAEREVLEASRTFLTSHRVKLSCCSYHRPSDGRYLTRLLRGMGFKTRYSEGWMVFFNAWGWPNFRRGVIYAQNFS